MKRFRPTVLARQLRHGGAPTSVRVQIQILLRGPFVAVFAKQEEFDLDRNVISLLENRFQLTVHPFAVGALRIREHHQANGRVFWADAPSTFQRCGSDQSTRW
jgi:hypothetical protein